MRVVETELAGARLFVPDVFNDDRGYFKETYSRRRYREFGVDDEFVQDSISLSSQNVIRGLHGDREMSKLVQVLRGRAWDVIVDARRDSPTFGKWQGFELSEDNHVQLYVPKGFLHGFLALTGGLIFSYKQSAYYEPAREFAARWDDPALAIRWPLDGEARISAKDQRNPAFAELR
ncbi:MAG: dTDP-4-dehydrorhamnose 3,5-epimerase [Candidatus Eremiobacteraeota bacterium]|nr:dTDP-4-dehydrorhamnose 3,5-epimerase [Candidatus Eremiobacteraeota bacterium]